MRIAILGGGPGGLFAATPAKAGDPSREVVLFERNRAEDTFGFGVVFSDATFGGIHADPVLRTALTEHGVHWDPIEVRLPGERFACHGNGMAADGASSQLREHFAQVFDPSVETAAAKFIWLGTSYPFESLTFVHERSPTAYLQSTDTPSATASPPSSSRPGNCRTAGSSSCSPSPARARESCR